MAKISVIIPVYNSELFLRECLESIQKQTIDDIEIICVDDGSTDSSIQLLEELMSEDPRYHFLGRTISTPVSQETKVLILPLASMWCFGTLMISLRRMPLSYYTTGLRKSLPTFVYARHGDLTTKMISRRLEIPTYALNRCQNQIPSTIQQTRNTYFFSSYS